MLTVGYFMVCVDSLSDQNIYLFSQIPVSLTIVKCGWKAFCVDNCDSQSCYIYPKTFPDLNKLLTPKPQS